MIARAKQTAIARVAVFETQGFVDGKLVFEGDVTGDCHLGALQLE